ncbi:MEDS domain-containing protein [Natrinema versiforme]|uniref:histidine kinase n=1 Tax=Natrinema versiforme JCM 10478 TaxID=1227496 RepID=L9Y793_9EURY|nr:MEDS domain-containing protein [Natrinema versiforme]ELY69501.1 histidine kinase [Natrinema versiforme JCM 10478]
MRDEVYSVDPGSDRRDDATGSDAGIRTDLARTDLDRHLALFYDSPTAQLEIAAAFIADALRNGRRCLYLADANNPTQIRAALETTDIDVESRLEAGDLEIRDATEAYLADGFDPDGMIDTLEAACAASIDAGYEGFSVAGENTWCFHTDESFDHVLEFEAEFDATCPELPVTALCQYDLDRFGERSIAKALWTHKQIIYRYTICDNPYYVPPSEYQSSADVRLDSRLMLEQLYDLTRSRRQIDRREQRLTVINRVLRHNVRNDLNTILGSLSLVRERDEIDDRSRERLEIAEQCARELVQTAEKARAIQQVVGESEVETPTLGSVIDSAVRQLRERAPGARIEVTGDEPSQTVLADAALDEALLELLTNGVIHQSADEPTVRITVTNRTDEFVGLEIENPGDPIPESDQRALQHGTETPLEHGSGLGLWLVKWIVEQSAGRLWFPESDVETCRIGIELRTVGRTEVQATERGDRPVR